MNKYYIIDLLECDIYEETYTGAYTEDDVVLIFRTKQDAMDKMKTIVAEQETWAEGYPCNVEWGDNFVDYDVNNSEITSRHMEIIEAKIV